ncbi:hypothetical protein [Urbifossiella limnaea]|uniref:Uncharacterized protein n=1 Tax=Urbifossiella limnaea TaxID=2528023 RepID=A0A517Y1X8_9BACT|nr:hypothetical protein [Urbifossiella limnaea]QDU23749.1 hypothetical protein ETAA1_57560 [Urbifossiella limnaea]
MTDATLTIEGTVHITRRGHGGRPELRDGPAPAEPPPERVPRVARLMALAIKLDGLVRTGVVRDYAALARLGRVTPARITQVMNLTLLAPDIQEALLFLPPVTAGREPLALADLQPVAAVRDWRGQRRAWRELTARRPNRRAGE